MPAEIQPLRLEPLQVLGAEVRIADEIGKRPAVAEEIDKSTRHLMIQADDDVPRIAMHVDDEGVAAVAGEPLRVIEIERRPGTIVVFEPVVMESDLVRNPQPVQGVANPASAGLREGDEHPAGAHRMAPLSSLARLAGEHVAAPESRASIARGCVQGKSLPGERSLDTVRLEKRARR